MSTSSVIDFGFDPEDSQNHFVVLIPRSKKQDVMIFELPNYNEGLDEEGLLANFLGQTPFGKTRLKPARWAEIQSAVRTEFGQRLKTQGQRKRPSWQPGINRLHRHLGKELTVLAWSIEEVAGKHIDMAVHNWLALRPEERWWLYTMTNAGTGHPENGRGRGWRRALRYALAESPVADARTTSYIDDVVEAAPQMLFEPGAVERG